jgi:hypothetical protein
VNTSGTGGSGGDNVAKIRLCHAATNTDVPVTKT